MIATDNLTYIAYLQAMHVGMYLVQCTYNIYIHKIY